MADKFEVSRQFMETAVMCALFVTRSVDEDGDDFALYAGAWRLLEDARGVVDVDRLESNFDEQDG